MNPLTFLDDFLAHTAFNANGQPIYIPPRQRSLPEVLNDFDDSLSNSIANQKRRAEDAYKIIERDLNPGVPIGMSGIFSRVNRIQESPEWLKSVANTRSSKEYNQRLANSDEITFGGRKIRFVEADTSNPIIEMLAISPEEQARRYRSRTGFADSYNTDAYEQGLAALIKQKERETGRRYNIQ